MVVVCLNGTVKLFTVQHYRFLGILLDVTEVQPSATRDSLQVSPIDSR
jgi:hypothetical protein